METENLDIAESYFKLVKNLSHDVKLDLIKRLSESLLDNSKEKKDDSWKDLFGAWESEDSAEEIIEGLREERQTNRKIEDL